MSKIIAIGEALIDFLPGSPGSLSSVASFTKSPGGAPANVAAAAARLGVSSMVITKLGLDAFGDYLTEAMRASGIDTRGVSRSGQANTGLAFVSNTTKGEREFLFYRSPSADMLLSPEDIDPDWFQPGDALHFCSVALVDAPCRRAHDKAIRLAREKGCRISFDVNLRFPLWPDKSELKAVALEYISKADLVKVSDEELDFLGEFSAPCRILTMGARGAKFSSQAVDLTVEGFDTPAVDTTGAGDAFIGAFLAKLIMSGGELPKDAAEARSFMVFCHAAASIVVGRKGAMVAMPSFEEVGSFLLRHERA